MDETAWPFYPLAFLHDAARCLALVRQGRLSLNPQARLQIGSVPRLVRHMLIKPQAAHPRAEAQAPLASFLVGLLGQAGLIASAQNGLLLNATAYDWLGLPAALQIEQLRQVWWFAPSLNARWLPPARHQTPLDSLWRQIQSLTCEWAVSLLPGQWTPADDIEPRLIQAGLIGKVIKGRTLPQVRQAIEQRTLAVAHFIIEFALPCLGLVEISSQADATHMRPTLEGAGWLRAALALRAAYPRAAPDSSSPPVAQELLVPSQGLCFPTQAASQPAVTVEPDLVVNVHLSASNACTFDIAHFASLVSLGCIARYQITPQTLKQAVAWGYPISDVTFLLASFSRGVLPPEAVAQLDRWQQAMTLITCEEGYRLELAEAAVFHLLRQQDPFRNRTQPFASGQAAWVSRAHSKELFRYLRRSGYTLDVRPPRSSETSEAVLNSYRRALPLPQLTVALRTYQHLHSIIPGLAGLNLQDLVAALSAALPSDEQAAAQRLFESNVILLAREVSRPTDKETVAGMQVEKTTVSPSPLDTLSAHLQAMIDRGESAQIKYADTKANVTTRRVQPLRLETRWGQEYLVAYCDLRQDERSFRLDRIIQSVFSTSPPIHSLTTRPKTPPRSNACVS